MMSTTIKIPFATQAMGYDRNQVDKYIQKLADEYRNLQQKFNELSSRTDSSPDRQLIERQSADRQNSNMEAISKAIVDAEVKAIQIVAEAKNEASRVVGNAYNELGKIQQEKERVVTEINGLVKRLIDVVPASDEQRVF